MSISRAFDAETGLLSFLEKSFKFSKLFKESNVKILELFLKVIQKEKKSINQYAEAIVDVRFNLSDISL